KYILINNIKYKHLYIPFQKEIRIRLISKRQSQMIIKSAGFMIYIFLLTLQFYVKAQKTQMEGCITYINGNDNSSQNQCRQCDESYELNSKKNICIYKKCDSNQYYENNQYFGPDGSKCVAVCNSLTWGNQETNLCQAQDKCTTSIIQQSNKYFNITIFDFFVYQNNYYVAQSSYFSIYDKTALYFIKALQYQKNDIIAAFVNGLIFVGSKDYSFSIWDIIKDQRISKYFDASNLIQLNEKSKMVSLQNMYVVVYTVQFQSIQLQIIYDEISQAFSSSNYQGSYFNILPTSQLGIYLLAQDQSVQLINISNNQIQSIQPGIVNNEKIIKISIFQVLQADLKEYLIINTLNQLLFKDLRADSQSQVIQYNQQIKYFDIYNFWGTSSQIIVIFENLDIKIFDFDPNLQQFIQSSPSFSLNYYPQISKKIKYKNQSANGQEFIYELASICNSSILIIKKGSFQQQQNQQIQIQTITNFNSSYPYQSTSYEIGSTLKFDNTSLISYANTNLEVNIYDYSDYSNYKLKKQFWLEQVGSFKVSEKFYYNKLIVQIDCFISIIDIFTQNIVQSFISSFLQYATNNDKFLIVANKCLRVYSSDLSLLLENCESNFQYFTYLQKMYLTNDLKVVLIQQYQQTVGVYQIDLNKQSVTKLYELKNLDWQCFQIVKQFSSIQDEINNNYSIQQILAFGQNGNFKIYNFNLELIYQINVPLMKNIYYINKIKNDDNIYILIGIPIIIYIDISTNEQSSFQLDILKNFNVLENQKIINLTSKDIYYQIRLYYQNKIYEYLTDFKRKITYQTNIDQVKETGLLFTSLVQKQRYSVLFDTSIKFYIFQSYQYAKNIVVDLNQTYLFDIFTNKQLLVVQIQGKKYQVIRNNKQLLIWRVQSLCLIDLQSSTVILNYNVQMNGMIGVQYDENENLFYLYGNNFIFVLNGKMESAYTIYKDSSISIQTCYNSQQNYVCLFSETVNQSFNYSVLLYNKISKYISSIDLGVNKYNKVSIDVDIQYENILIYYEFRFLIYGFNQFLKFTLERTVKNCLIQSQFLLCESQNSLILIDRTSLNLTDLGLSVGIITFKKYLYIDFINQILFQSNEQDNQISIVDVSSKQIINSLSSRVQLNQTAKARIKDFQFDNSSSCLMYIDEQGTFYLVSIDKNYPFQTFLQILDLKDKKDYALNFFYYNITNDIIISSFQTYKLDYDTLGWQHEPQINEPYYYFTKVPIRNSQTDYLVFNKYNNTLFRYSSPIQKFELDISGTRILDIQYNQNIDVLVVALQDSLLFYQQYQYIYCFSLNKNQNMLVVGLSDGQVLSYSITNQTYFILGITNSDSQLTSINFIKFKEASDSQYIAYVVSNRAILLQIDTQKQQVIQQIDLKFLINEDPKSKLNNFLIDEAYQRYIFCFIEQKKAYVWNFSKQKQEQFLFMPSIYTNTTIQFFTVIKKNFLKDTITYFKLVSKDHNYTNPHILDYLYDPQSKQLKVLGFHSTGVFENNYNLDFISNESKQSCNILISSSGKSAIQDLISQIYPIKTQVQTVDGLTLIDKQNQQNNIYLQIPSYELKNLIDQTIQFKNQVLVISSNNDQNSILPLQNNTFSQLALSVLQLANFNFDFQNSTNLVINITQNQSIQQVIFQNITISLQCFGSNQIIISNIQQVVFQNIRELTMGAYLGPGRKSFFLDTFYFSRLFLGGKIHKNQYNTFHYPLFCSHHYFYMFPDENIYQIHQNKKNQGDMNGNFQKMEL
ncbi:hypothetical protein ABPG73_016915, partial [Tetrahymena malaccensis]